MDAGKRWRPHLSFFIVHEEVWRAVYDDLESLAGEIKLLEE